MHEERTVRQVMADHIWAVHPKQAIESALRRLSREGSRSAIVSDHGVPVGVFDSVTVREACYKEDEQVEDVMLRDIPSLTEETTIDEASDRTIASGVDRLPVVDREGYLIGEITRRDLVAETRAELESGELRATRAEPKVIDANDPASVLSDAEAGMVAVAADGVRVGIVVDVHIVDVADTWLVVEHGMLNKKRAIVDGGLVDLVDGDVVILSIDQTTFKSLPSR